MFTVLLDDCIPIGKELFKLTLRDGSLRNENWLIAFNLRSYSLEGEFIENTCKVLKKICVGKNLMMSMYEKK